LARPQETSTQSRPIDPQRTHGNPLARVPARVPLAVEHRPQKPDDHLICVANAVVVDDFCIG
jgi:hypothetical protein